jgi:hypothetical protein
MWISAAENQRLIRQVRLIEERLDRIVKERDEAIALLQQMAKLTPRACRGHATTRDAMGCDCPTAGDDLLNSSGLLNRRRTTMSAGR